MSRGWCFRENKVRWSFYGKTQIMLYYIMFSIIYVSTHERIWYVQYVYINMWAHNYDLIVVSVVPVISHQVGIRVVPPP